MNHNVTPQLAQQLLGLLNQDKHLSHALITLLEQEKGSLETRDYSEYHAVIQSKKQYLIDLEAADRERRDLMSHMGFSGDTEGFNQFVKCVPKSWHEKFQTSWDELSANLKKCRHLNEVNGRILSQSQTAIERLMGFMRGSTPTQTIYTSNGRKGSLAGNRSLAMA